MIDADTVVAIHEEILSTEPGLQGGHGIGPLEGALGRVANAIEYDGLDDVYGIAALYAVAIARGHVFNDANKRTALVTSLTYLSTQGIDVQRTAALEDIMVDVAQGVLDQKEFAELLFSIASWAPYVDEKTSLSLESLDLLQLSLAEVVKELSEDGVETNAAVFHERLQHIDRLARTARRNFEKARWAAAGAQSEFADWLAEQGFPDLIAP